MDPDLIEQADALLERAREAGVMIATAESCTGGLIAATLTEIAGSSDVFERGFVTYSNHAKHALLGVPEDLIARDGAVSETVARAMAEGALERSPAGLSMACTGIAGPGGGSTDKPVGLVHIAAARDGFPTLHERCLFGDPGRAAIRRLTVERAFALANQQLSQAMLA